MLGFFLCVGGGGGTGIVVFPLIFIGKFFF